MHLKLLNQYHVSRILKVLKFGLKVYISIFQSPIESKNNEPALEVDWINSAIDLRKKLSIVLENYIRGGNKKLTFCFSNWEDATWSCQICSSHIWVGTACNALCSGLRHDLKHLHLPINPQGKHCNTNIGTLQHQNCRAQLC